jgi:tetratricopeptide (TPR) repeat protein
MISGSIFVKAAVGKYEEALQAFEQAIELDPKDERIQIEKMKLLREIGYKEDA